MGWARSTGSTRQRLWLLLGIAAVALSLLAMHQLSGNHTAANPSAGPLSQSMAVLHVDGRHGTDRAGPGAGNSEHAHLRAVAGEGQLTSEDGGCPGCAGHPAMVLTCLAVLILLGVGVVLTRPAAWRTARLGRLLPRTLHDTRPGWRPRPRSLTELSISRT